MDVPELESLWDEAKGYIECGEQAKAIEIYRYILIRYSENPVAVEYANAYLGDIFLTNNSLALAKRHLIKAINLAPDNAHYYYLLGFAFSKGEEWGKAIKQFNQALKLKPNTAEYERGLGWAVLNNGDVNGVNHLYRALELSPFNPRILTDLAAAMLILGNVNRAREYAELTLEIDPEYDLAKRILQTIEDLPI